MIHLMNVEKRTERAQGLVGARENPVDGVREAVGRFTQQDLSLLLAQRNQSQPGGNNACKAVISKCQRRDPFLYSATKQNRGICSGSIPLRQTYRLLAP